MSADSQVFDTVSTANDRGGADLLSEMRMQMIVEQEDDCHSQAASEHHGSLVFRHASEGFHDAILDLYAATKIFCIHLVTFESMFVILCSIVTTTLYYVFGHNSDGTRFGANISWMIVSFAIVAPMIMQIKQAFARREMALDVMAEAKALFVNILLANTLWNWGKNGRSTLPPDHALKTKTLLKQLLFEVSSILLMPTHTRGRHRLTVHGQRVASKHAAAIGRHQLSIVAHFKRLHEQVEVMKGEGLPANEASRINQYHWMLHARLEKLFNIKFYRTPQATRSFTRLFILVLPIFYGPYYVYLTKSDEYHSTNFVFCLALSVVTSLSMIGVFNVEKAMGDPFVGGGMDRIRVRETISQMHEMLDIALETRKNQ
ncbi:TPA: hypothetical protein N0F65_002412 [Lagenidium giganteum]|uniref:Uncharacterized protein n=1 Tax=Lagenidium giganteum TaxID=4803 RepID=A0AAV2YQ86_9STRA|nr:TPA: hypothetical protein N0F65_002412 [Lagenidium giganteum]